MTTSLPGGGVEETERDVFAMGFLVFALTDLRAQALIEAGSSVKAILDFYKDRAFVDNDSSKQ